MRRTILIPLALILLPLLFSMLGAQSVRSGDQILLTSRGGQNALNTAAISSTGSISRQSHAVRGIQGANDSLRVDSVEQSDAFSVGTGTLTPTNLGLEELQVSSSGTDASKNNAFGWCCFCLPPTPPSGSVVGTVVDEKGNPLRRATVRISGTDRGCFSDSNGCADLGNIPPGDYTVRISYAGMWSVERQVKITAGSVIELGTVLMERKVFACCSIGCAEPVVQQEVQEEKKSEAPVALPDFR